MTTAFEFLRSRSESFFPPAVVRSTAERAVRDALARVDVRIGGDRPFDITVRDESFFELVARDGLSGAREAYVDGLWDTERLDELTYRILKSPTELPLAHPLRLQLRELVGRLVNRQSPRRGLEVRRHYDLGNDLYAAMLDPLMNYSCGYWRQAETLAAAQEAKLDLCCKKLGLKPGMRVLDIGCGFGGFARFAAERYGVSVVGVTISERQLEYGRRACRDLPVELRLLDYRKLSASAEFDAAVSIGMFEHVGPKNYRTYLETVRRALRPNGLFLLHTIGGSRSVGAMDPWTDKYIFPNAILPSAGQLASACEGIFVVEDWHNFGPDYDRTLMAWYENFERSWPSLRPSYGDAFFRLWKCYLLTSAGAFRAREHHTWQVMLSGNGVPGGYSAVR